ncbi:MAG TPA: hypothetical protein VNQ76_00445 [Planctomicrobium sp.]|nr:hypothetical protein [Planctomicrobium sp.]
MLHGSLTLLMRSIRDDALQQHPHLLRLMSAMILLTMFVVAMGSPGYSGVPGLIFFEQLAYLGIALITLAAIGHFSSSITEEKEEGTLGLLLLANISPLAILLGKSTNRILSAFLLLATLFPFSLLALTLGGITSLQIVAVFLALGAYLFLTANLALLVSVLVQRSTEAIVVMTLLMLALHGVPEILQNSIRLLTQERHLDADSVLARFSQGLYHIHQEISVIHEIRRIFKADSNLSLINWQGPVSIAVGLLLFWLAAWRFSLIVWASDSSEPSDPKSINQSNRWVKWVSRPWPMAIAWKEFHFIAGGPVLFIVKSLTYLGWIALCLINEEWIRNLFGMSALWFLRFSFLIFLVAELFVASSQFFQIERRNGTLSTLFMLPQSLFWISLQKTLGCLTGSIPTILALAVLSGIGTQEHVAGWTATHQQTHHQFLILLIAGCALFVTCQLTVLCSLYVNWGALPLAIALMVILAGICAPLITGMIYVLREQHQPDYAQFGPVLYLAGMISIGLQFEILRRLQFLCGR